MIDIAAHRLDIDPTELRLRNLVDSTEMPYATGTHTDGHPVVYDSGDYARLLDRALERFGYERWRRPSAAGRRRGVGLAFFVEKSGIARWEYARVELASRGDTRVYSGGASL